jgi:hypothetical protein
MRSSNWTTFIIVFVLVFIEYGKQEKCIQGFRQIGGDNIKMDRREMGWGSMDWIAMGQDRDR